MELKQMSTEAYHHLTQLIKQANIVMGSFFAGECMEDNLHWHEECKHWLASKKDADTQQQQQADMLVDDKTDSGSFQEKDDENIYFPLGRGTLCSPLLLEAGGSASPNSCRSSQSSWGSRKRTSTEHSGAIFTLT
ncbi:hypothetical protein BC827DRAFT_1158082 [Russula dissimulans]|nr:hypothetical protein BC827DRAFT_1158082 [Russula dissimulans]